MNDIDIFKILAENLSNRKSNAILSNYEVLCNNIDYVNKTLKFALLRFGQTQKSIADKMQNDALVNIDFQDASNPLFYFRTIIPRILLNGSNVCNKLLLLTEADEKISKQENLYKCKRSFSEYNDLVTGARQYIDSLVADVYQLVLLEPKSINYHILVSLNSFNKYATKSLRHSLFNEPINDALTEFEKIDFAKWKNSSITKCAHDTFGKKVNYLFQELSITDTNNLKDEIKNLFKFSSEFAHIGFVSTFFTSTYDNEVILADQSGTQLYLPSTENFSELKYQLLETAMNFFCVLYLPAVVCCCMKVFQKDTFQSIKEELVFQINDVKARVATRNNEYYFFILNGLIESKQVISLKCRCNAVTLWAPPHEAGNLFCVECGSVFKLIVMEKDGYILTSEGPARPVGSSLPDVNELPIDEKEILFEQCNACKVKK